MIMNVFSENASAWIAAGGAGVGAIALEVTKRWLDRSQERNNMSKQIRDELRADVLSKREEVIQLQAEKDKLESEVELWRTKFFEIQEQHSKLKALYEDALIQIQGKARETVETAKAEGIMISPDVTTENN